MQNYKDLKVWDKAHQLTLEVYKATKTFPKEEVFGLISQLKRASSSIPANMAERCDKNSNQELAHFINISLVSANETEYFLILLNSLWTLKLPSKSFEISTTLLTDFSNMVFTSLSERCIIPPTLCDLIKSK